MKSKIARFALSRVLAPLVALIGISTVSFAQVTLLPTTALKSPEVTAPTVSAPQAPATLTPIQPSGPLAAPKITLTAIGGIGMIKPRQTIVGPWSPIESLPVTPKAPATPIVGPTEGTTPAELSAADSCEAFGFDFYRELVSLSGYGATNDTNVALSPISLASVLEILRLGAVNTTQQQLSTALHTTPVVSGSGLSLPNAAALTTQGVTLSTANSLWLSNTFSVKSAYLASVNGEFGKVVKSIDFSTPATAAATINQWVSTNTAGHITDILNAGDFPNTAKQKTAMVVANAVYFKGSWANAFDPGATENGQFHLASGGYVSVPMMHQTTPFLFGVVDGVKILEMPYVGEGVSMVLLLPSTDAPNGGTTTGGFYPGWPILVRSGTVVSTGSVAVSGSAAPTLASGTLTTSQMEALVDENWLSNALSQLRSQTVIVAVPKFKFTCQPDAASVLQGLGVTQMFSPSYDFSPIPTVANDELWVAVFKHRAWLAVDEVGTEAAAATVGVIGVTATCVGPPPPPPPQFIADHPFLFVIRHNATGTPLFIGRVSNPLTN